MSATINGNVISWAANDTTPIILKCGIKKIGISSNVSIKVNGDKDTYSISPFQTLLNNSNELPNVYGYPNCLTPLPHETAMSVIITPAPHINPNWVSDCGSLLTVAKNK